MLLQLNALVVAGSTFYLRNKDVSLASLSQAPLHIRAIAAAATASGTLLGALLLEKLAYKETEVGPITRVCNFLGGFFGHESSRKIVVNNWIEEYNAMHKSDSPEVRNSAYAKLVNSYYELATIFYEWGWGSSFHFAYRLPHESFTESICRHEYYLSGFLQLKPGSKVLDVGCGIGGPLRNIARFNGWDVTGVTINEFQVLRGNQHCQAQGLADRCRLVKADFMKLPYADASFDGVYAIEATCHAPDRKGVYGEIMRVLKPGGVFACYEWCLTDKYDKGSAEHKRIKKLIEEGDGLPDMALTTEVDVALKSVGFEILSTRDMALDRHQRVPWYMPLTPSWNPLTQRFQFNWLGLILTTYLLKALEFCYLVPAGTSKIQTMLQAGGMGCARGGQTGVFTPMYLCVCRKPK